MFAMRRNDDAEALRVIDSVGVMAMRWFMPSSLLTLVFGIVVTVLGNLWGEAWVLLGLAGFAATFVTGHFLLRPRAMAVARLKAGGRFDEAVAEGRAMMRICKFDYTLLFVVVALMVLKPTWGDFVTLGVLAAVIAVAGLLFLALGRRPVPAAA